MSSNVSVSLIVASEVDVCFVRVQDDKTENNSVAMTNCLIDLILFSLILQLKLFEKTDRNSPIRKRFIPTITLG